MLKIQKEQSNSTFYCFSPQAMMATLITEIVLAVFLLLRGTKTSSAKVGVLILFFLALFQLSEYGICENFGLSSTGWAQLGFASITILPPLGLHLVYAIAHKRPVTLVKAAYIAALIWIIAFLTTGIIGSPVCGGNYVIFHLLEPLHIAYTVYYNALLLIAMWRAVMFSLATKQTHIKKALRLLVLGYASFILPSLAIALIYGAKGPGNAIPSVMCGFAVLFAIILGLKVVPLSNPPKR